jgi:hypothetical protein
MLQRKENLSRFLPGLPDDELQIVFLPWPDHVTFANPALADYISPSFLRWFAMMLENGERRDLDMDRGLATCCICAACAAICVSCCDPRKPPGWIRSQSKRWYCEMCSRKFEVGSPEARRLPVPTAFHVEFSGRVSGEGQPGLMLESFRF